FVPPRRRLRRQDSARGEAGRPAGRAAHQVRSRRQPHDCQGARPGDTDHSTRSRRRGDRVKRRQFITLLGGSAAAWPFAATTQQPMPVVGVLGSASAQFKDAFVRGLSEAGYVEGQNVRVEYRWAAGACDRLSAMADELVNLLVNVIATFGA